MHSERKQSSSQSPYMTSLQAAKHLKMSPKTLEKYRAVGGGPVFRKHGRRVIYRISDLDAWSDERKAHSTAETACKGWV
jgi:hypothetical protein